MTMNILGRTGLLMSWCCLLLMKVSTIIAAECSYEVNVNGISVCCPPCNLKEKSQVCPNTDERCRCSPGYGCTTKSCISCKKLPDCQSKRSQLIRKEETNTVYNYECEQCPQGKYFHERTGTCMPDERQIIPTESSRTPSSVHLTQKPESKINTMEDNKTKITKELSSDNWTFLALFTGLVVFILLLITVAIHLFIWKMKTAQLLKIAGEPFHMHSIINRSPREDLDSWSCQYPEEEHGEHGLAEKHHV